MSQGAIELIQRNPNVAIWLSGDGHVVVADFSCRVRLPSEVVIKQEVWGSEDLQEYQGKLARELAKQWQIRLR